MEGIGAAPLTPGSLAILEASFTPDDRARAIGAWSGLSGVSIAAGPLIGGCDGVAGLAELGDLPASACAPGRVGLSPLASGLAFAPLTRKHRFGGQQRSGPMPAPS
jgi:MFS family permease